MASEHERKFLLSANDWRDQVTASTDIVQGYLLQQKNCSVRVRLSTGTTGTHATINIKSTTIGVSRSEFEYDIPEQDARQMLAELCLSPFIEKTRHSVHYSGHHWEIDEFAGSNKGLVVAELELDDPGQQFTRPPWLGEEVSGDPRYYNTCLQSTPYSTWNR